MSTDNQANVEYPQDVHEAHNVQALHAPIMREQAEPRDGFEPVPFWVAVIFGGLLAWGGYYVGTNSADFRRDDANAPHERRRDPVP